MKKEDLDKIVDILTIEECPVCYGDIWFFLKYFDETQQSDESDIVSKIVQDTENYAQGVKLSCGHKFCVDCLRSHITSLVEEQQRFDNLMCPQHGCEALMNDDELQRYGGEAMYEKVQQFKRDRLVAQDREHLMFCSKLDCDSVIDLRKAGRRRRVTCAVCNADSCKLCRQEFHGEWSRCPTENGIEEWRRNQPNSLTANCPKCGCFIEKNMGCP